MFSSWAILKPGNWLLVQGGSSGTGIFTVQLAHALGSKVIIPAGSHQEYQRCLALGASRAINHKTTDFVATTRDFTGGVGVDVILDMVGGDYIQRGLETLAPDDRLILLAFKQAAKLEVDCELIQIKNP